MSIIDSACAMAKNSTIEKPIFISTDLVDHVSMANLADKYRLIAVMDSGRGVWQLYGAGIGQPRIVMPGEKLVR